MDGPEVAVREVGERDRRLDGDDAQEQRDEQACQARRSTRYVAG